MIFYYHGKKNERMEGMATMVDDGNNNEKALIIELIIELARKLK